MKWYTAIGCKMEDDEGRLLVKIDSRGEGAHRDGRHAVGGSYLEPLCRKIESIPKCTGYYALHLEKSMQPNGRTEEDFLFA